MDEKNLSSSGIPSPRRKWIAILLVALVVAIGIWLVSSKRDVARTNAPLTTSIGIATWPGFAPAFIAKERGFFKNLNVSVNVLDDFTARQAAFVSGKTDFTIYTIDSLAFDAGKGLDGKIVMILDRSNGADGIVARAGIRAISDLKGKKVAYTRGSPAHFLLFTALSKAGLQLSDIETVEVDDPTRAAEAFLAGSVDAAVTWEPYLSQIVKSRKGVVLGDTRTIDDRIIDVLVARNEVIAEHPEIVQAVVSGWMQALDEVAHPKADTFAIMAKGLGMPEADFRGGAAGVAFADRAMNAQWLVPVSSGQSKASLLFDDAAKLWQIAGFGKPPKVGVSYVTDNFVRALPN